MYIECSENIDFLEKIVLKYGPPASKDIPTFY